MLSQKEEYNRQRLAQERTSGQKRPYGNPQSEMPIDNKGLGKPQNLDIQNNPLTLSGSNGHSERLKNAREQDYNKDSVADDSEKQHGAFRETAESLKKTAKGSKLTAPLRAISLAMKLRKDVENHEASPWIIAFVIALSCDFVFDLIPIAGWVIALFFKPFLFVFLWGKGTWKVKIVYYLLLMLDFFPIIQILPLSTICVAYAFSHSEKKAKLSAKLLREVKSETSHYLENR
jgi:hypothetical protein